MNFGTRIAIAAAFVVIGVPAMSLAESLTDPVPPGKIIYPYKDLPGVTAPHPAVDDDFKCHTAPGRVYMPRGMFYDSLPTVGYVCDQNGVISSGNHPPNRQFWQYNDLNR